MAILKIKFQNKKCRIECQEALFPAFLLELEEKLKCQFFYKNGYFEVYFSFPFKLNDAQCEQLFALCDMYHTYVMEIEHSIDHDESVLMEHCFHNGEIYTLTSECIYIGDIDKNVQIISNKSIFVVGKVKGIIDLLYKDCSINASSFEDARIRIFDSAFQNVTNNAPGKVYYENEKIKVQ